MSKQTVILTGTATVEFRKVIRGLDVDEVEQLLNDKSHAAFQIDLDDCQHLGDVVNIEVGLKP